MPLPAASATANPPLYSQRSVRLFSLLFTAIAGGVFTAHNLRTVGQPDAARKALWGSVAVVALMAIVLALLPYSPNTGAYTVGVGLASAYGLNGYADRFIANPRDFPTKSIWRPLAICLLVFVPIVALLIYAF
ncbi:hypothetical protein [Hymenobacter amundsenii]|uniref:hypothetical protein n=1 Tax=Hymenobacter amundsenii TaxID=2006685 RepID=UPI000F81E6C7|nr:hypothetical protein [Hymenobacter amundsenii]